MDNESNPQSNASDRRTDEGKSDEDPSVRNNPRYYQLYPVLSDSDVDRIRRFGSLTRRSAGDVLYRTGGFSPGMFVLLSGTLRAVVRDGLGHERVVRAQMGRGEFSSDIGQLAGRPAVADVVVTEDVEAILLPTERLRALMIAEAELGERIMRALILRRVAAIERGNGAVLVGTGDSARFLGLQNFLRRNSQPYLALDAHHDADAIALLHRLAPKRDDFPLVICPDGSVLRNPDNAQLASCLGLVPEFDLAHVYDVVIVGAGPAGLAAAVYAASEGLSVAVLDCGAPGGQAGASMRIENYLGFPTGISGQALAGRAFNQAQKFGAHIGIPCEVKALHCGASPLAIEMSDTRHIKAHTVVIATGAEYRRPAVDNLSGFEGRGVYYWASPVEARLCRQDVVILVGGGNSAGQAVAYLADHAAHVHLLIRGADLHQSMSRYLIERLTSLSNVTMHRQTEVTRLEGTDRLERVHYRTQGDLEDQSIETHHLFLFIGAEPNTGWLQTCGVSVDAKGFVLTGTDVAAGSTRSLPLQTSVDGVFAIGDVRAGSIKRVAAAVGEGAAVVAQIHRFLTSVARSD
ncbi:FAD-dependent pyridine nucleotide-disulfide oxidoreductase [Caballeronia calidae]|uniref:FAD-dependent pyridine nucleotide-disulfide oxidoreductase n=1 Tax=Caballeronia calidae TaxID=1777139 RepID=A0A158EC07_9BURK|nr:FAD-dependent pyridine nucleotide-disulfide oxidoreductase [Caballeronia calidae]